MMTVTSGFLRNIQRKANFTELLAGTRTACPKMAQLLTDLPTAAPMPVVYNPPSGGPERPSGMPAPSRERDREPVREQPVEVESCEAVQER